MVEGEPRVSLVEQARHPFVLPPPAFIPRRYKPRNVGEWTGHLAFASDLIVSLQPKLIVELGTHWGEAYFTFCQTVQEHGLSSVCYAIDHWLGDEHAGHYGEEVFDEVSEYNNRYYRQFSYLLRRSFDDALPQFADDSIDLLHIDGLHTYEAVSHDFRNWLPKVTRGGVILLHDICPRHQDFGVWRLWEEIKAEFPDTFEFHHSWGLGVVRKDGKAFDTALTELLFQSSLEVREDVRRHYVIYASHLEHLLGPVPAASAPPAKVELSATIRVQVFPCIDGVYSPDTSQIHKMSAGTWNTLVFELQDPNIRGPLRIDPGSEPSFIEVGDILVHSLETGDLLWSSPGPSAQREFQIAGTALPFPDDASFLVNAGDDPQLLLTTLADLQGPLKVTVTLKVMPVAQAAMEAALIRAKAARAREETLQNTLQLLAEAQKTIVGIENSLSWKITAPLRRFMAALRASRGR